MTLLDTRNPNLALALLSSTSSVGKAGEQQAPKPAVSTTSSELSGQEIFFDPARFPYCSDSQNRLPRV